MGFQQGLSGLNAASKSLDVIGNNVANSSTVGFKESQAQFADVYASSLSGGGNQAGIGVKVATVAQQFTQGNITTTNNSLDMAVSGSGFFRMDNNGSITYSRNGQFQLDKDGFIVDNQGNNLTGFLPNAAGVIVATTPGPIQISTADLLPRSTANIVAGLNLDARNAIPAVAPFDPTNPLTFNNSTSTTIYDSLGGSHVASLYFVKTATNAWAQYLTVDGISVPMATNPQPLTFSTSGVLTSPVNAVSSTAFTPQSAPITLAGSSTTIGMPVVSVPSTTGLLVGATVTGPGILPGTTITGVNVPLANQITLSANATATNGGVTLTATNPAGAAPQTLSFNFSATSQFGSTFGVNSMTQDGYTSGHLTGFSTGSDGIVTGRYSNGQTRNLAQVVLANFTDKQGLQPLGDNQWAETSTSGAPLVGVPGSASLGLLQTSAVEDSNVDLTAELVNMITAQRAYQANAQTIKTQDQVLQTIVNLR